LCSIECCQFHAINDPDCPPNRVFCADMDAWGKVTSNIFIWNYNTNFSAYHLPVPNLRIIERNVRYFVERGAKGIFMQAAGDTTGGEFSDLRNYLIANLLWDPQRDGRRLIDEFLDLHYRGAAPPIRRYLNLLHDRTATGLHRNCYGDAAGFGVNEEIARVLTEAFGEAMRLADDDEVRARVEKASVIAYRVALELCWYLKPDQKLDPETATRLRPAFEKYFALCEKYQIQRVAEMELATDARKRLARHFEP
jgi:hypothetical protein